MSDKIQLYGDKLVRVAPNGLLLDGDLCGLDCSRRLDSDRHLDVLVRCHGLLEKGVAASPQTACVLFKIVHTASFEAARRRSN